jgi:Xaa-Pro aminopeptidase
MPPSPPGHAFFHGKKAPPLLATNVVIAVGNCGLYTGPWGVRVEDAVVARPEGSKILTDFVRKLEM